jgi:hypothetical protein
MHDILACDNTRMALRDGLGGTCEGTMEGKAALEVPGLD